MELHARLVHAEAGSRVVEVRAMLAERCLGSALGEAATAQEAEDLALRRLLQRLQGSPAEPATTAAAEPATAAASPVPIRRAAAAPAGPQAGSLALPLASAKPLRRQPLGPSHPTAAPAIPAGITPALNQAAGLKVESGDAAMATSSPAAPSQARPQAGHRSEAPASRPAAAPDSHSTPPEAAPLPHDSASFAMTATESGSEPRPDPGEEPPADPEDWSQELTALDLQLRRLGWNREQEGTYLLRAFGHTSRSRLTRYGDLCAYLSALEGLAPGSDPSQAAVPLRRSELLAQGDGLLARLGWDAERGRAFLESQLQRVSRRQLSDMQLLQFNMLLEGELLQSGQVDGTAPPAGDGHTTQANLAVADTAVADVAVPDMPLAMEAQR